VDIIKLISDRFDTEQEAVGSYYGKNILVRIFSDPNPDKRVHARTYTEITAATTPYRKYTDVRFVLTHLPSEGKYMYVCHGET
jgi:hypothetical protein